MRFAQLVIGIKGHGKTTYCKLMSHYAESKGRKVKIVNLDAKAQTLNYDRNPTADIRSIITEDDYYNAERAEPGTGAGFTFILRQVVENPDWLFNQIGEIGDDDHVFFDCPGERDYFAHVKGIKVLCTALVMRNFRVCIVYVRDCTLCHNGYEYICSCLSPLTSFINLSLPHVNVFMKYDKLTDEEKSRLQLFINSDVRDVLRFENGRPTDQPDPELVAFATAAMQILDGHSLVRKKYFPLDAKDDNSFKSLLFLIDEVQGISED